MRTTTAASNAAWLALLGASSAQQFLAPANDINLPSSGSASEPLRWVGANGPWVAGPNVHGISADVPEGCTVDQAAYVSRHGSRYPDTGAYNGWVEWQKRTASPGYTATGSLAFLKKWVTPLTNPELQIAMENPTGIKEAQDMGYQLRTRYPQLYREGDEFPVWSNNYTRVLQTARAFVQGFLGFQDSAKGSVISVTAKGFPEAMGNSLAPADMCPTFRDGNGLDFKTTWDNIYLPPIRERLQAMLSGDLVLNNGDVEQMAYLCGFESHITGRLSEYCGVLNDEELKDYQYGNDLRYYYGRGPGVEVAPKMMMPFLDAVVKLFTRGPGLIGKREDGSSFNVPDLLMSFLNDGQLTELLSATGVMDTQAPLSGTSRDDDRLWVGSRYVVMRGTIAFERLNCIGGPGNGNVSMPMPTGTGTSYTSRPTTMATSTKGGNNGTVSTSGTAGHASTTKKPCGGKPTSSHETEPATTASATWYANPYNRRQANTGNTTYMRILLNDAVWPIQSCRSGPGGSCRLADYAKFITDKYAAQGDWLRTCNITDPQAPTKVAGASFFTDLSSAFLQRVPV
jgi:acid phosphatase